MNEIMDEINVSTRDAGRERTDIGMESSRTQIELTSLLYENLPYIDMEDLSEAIYHAAAGNEKELLRLLRHKDNK